MNPAMGRPIVAVKDGAATDVAVKKGVIATVDGTRWGKVNGDPDSDNEVKLTWLDGESQSGYTKADTFKSVVATKDDLVMEYLWRLWTF